MESEELRGVEAAFDDVLHGVLVSAVSLPPVRAGIGKGIGQRDCECSLATSVCVAVERHEESGGLCGEETADDVARDCLDTLGKLRVAVYELEGLPARERRRRVVALRPILEFAEGYAFACTPAAVEILAEIQLALL
jgi:hypothetical protein